MGGFPGAGQGMYGMPTSSGAGGLGGRGGGYQWAGAGQRNDLNAYAYAFNAAGLYPPLIPAHQPMPGSAPPVPDNAWLADGGDAEFQRFLSMCNSTGMPGL